MAKIKYIYIYIYILDELVLKNKKQNLMIVKKKKNNIKMKSWKCDRKFIGACTNNKSFSQCFASDNH